MGVTIEAAVIEHKATVRLGNERRLLDNPQ
jgi:hypothetical protein